MKKGNRKKPTKQHVLRHILKKITYFNVKLSITKRMHLKCHVFVLQAVVSRDITQETHYTVCSYSTVGTRNIM